jgi:SlyX protein
MMDDMEARLIELETLVAFHEETITGLSSGLHEQQKAVDDLTRRLADAESKLREVRVGEMDPADDPPPPHY